MGTWRRQRRGRELVAGLMLVVSLVTAFTSDPGAHARERRTDERTATEARADLRDDLLRLTNDDRRDHDRRALDLAARISRYATRHSRRMADLGYIFHSGDRQLREALRGTGWRAYGENVGVGATIRSVQNAFMDSAPHRSNVLARAYDHAAIGIVEADDRTWVTVIYYGS